MSSETGCSGVPYLFSLELLVSLAIFCAPTHYSTLPLYIRYGLEFAVVCDRIHWGPHPLICKREKGVEREARHA
ncbi:hypothetical protein F4604DRAFT_1743314 [Suillus subluteus]|nr:hypothetical protein F4604DRAFT_1743314 [Suillus subluteus]